MTNATSDSNLLGPENPGHRICLIIPPSPFLIDERVFVSLGVLKVAAALEQAGQHVSVLDLSGVTNFIDVVEIFLADNDVEAIGITSTTPQLPAAFEIARKVRERAPHIRCILGGPHVTLTYASRRLGRKFGYPGALRAEKTAAELEEMFDVLCAGDGDISVLHILRDDVPKVLDGDDLKSPLFLSDSDFENSPWPSRGLVDMESYRYTIDNRPATSLIAQLGCPFGCGFCGGRASKSLRVIRNRPVQSIVDEVEFLHKEYGFTAFMFYDDELNVSKTIVELMNALSDLQDRLGVDFRLRGFVKSELFTEAQGEAMRRAGFRWLLCGFEAASDNILVNIGKRATLDDNYRAIEIAKKNDLKIKALMSIGHPGETEDTAFSIRDWLIDVEVDDFDCTVITVYPGTPYHDMAVPHATLPGVWTYTQPRTGDRLHAAEVDFTTVSEYYKGDPEGGYESFVFTDDLSAKEIVKIRDSIEKSVRKALGIKFNMARPGLNFEHSMGQGIPRHILRHAHSC